MNSFEKLHASILSVEEMGKLKAGAGELDYDSGITLFSKNLNQTEGCVCTDIDGRNLNYAMWCECGGRNDTRNTMPNCGKHKPGLDGVGGFTDFGHKQQ